MHINIVCVLYMYEYPLWISQFCDSGIPDADDFSPRGAQNFRSEGPTMAATVYVVNV